MKRPRSSGGLRLVGISGVDGSGKTSLSARLVQERLNAGERPVTLYVYGCVLCRRWSHRPPLSAAAASGGSGRLLAAARVLHSHVDAGEMTLRLLGAAVGSRWRGRSGPIVTDRSPLDALVKHDPPPGSLAGRWYLGMARRYDTLLWLDGDCAALAARDTDHTAAQLARAQAGFRKWSARLPHVVRIDTTSSTPSEVVRLASAALFGGPADQH